MQTAKDASDNIHNSGDFHAQRDTFIGNSFRAETIHFGQDGSFEQKRTAIARALTYQGIDAKRSFIKSASFKSFHWIWNTEFTSWLKSGEDVFWITGKAGSGKSTLMKFLSESKTTRQLLSSNGRSWSILHFYFDFRSGTSIANTPEGMLRSMLLQMVRKSKSAVESLYTINAPDQFQPSSVDDLLEATVATLQDEQVSRCIFIDGLDEYQGEQSDLVSILLRLIEQTTAKFILASRPMTRIDNALQDQPRLIVQDHNYDTIQAYLNSINSQLLFDLKTTCPSVILDKILQRADGVVLWARFAMEDILVGCAQEENLEKLQHRVASLPPIVDDMYESTLARIPTRLIAEAALYLHFIDRGQNYLTALELRALGQTMTVRDPARFHVPLNLSLRQFTQRLFALFGGLLVVVEEVACYYFLNFSPDSACWSAFNFPRLEDCTIQEVKLVHETLHAYLSRAKWQVAILPDDLQRSSNILSSDLYVAAVEREAVILEDKTCLTGFKQQWKYAANDNLLRKSCLQEQRNNIAPTSEDLLLTVASAKTLTALQLRDYTAFYHLFRKALKSPWIFTMIPLCKELPRYHELYKDQPDLFWALMTTSHDYIALRLEEGALSNAEPLIEGAVIALPKIHDGTLHSSEINVLDKIIRPLVCQGTPMLDHQLVRVLRIRWIPPGTLFLPELRALSRSRVKTDFCNPVTHRCKCGLPYCDAYNGFQHFVQLSVTGLFDLPVNSKAIENGCADFELLFLLYQISHGTINMLCGKNGPYLSSVIRQKQIFVGEKLFKVVVALAAGASVSVETFPWPDAEAYIARCIGYALFISPDVLAYMSELTSITEILHFGKKSISELELKRYVELAQGLMTEHRRVPPLMT